MQAEPRAHPLHVRHGRRDGGNGSRGLTDGLLLANEVVEASRLGTLVDEELT